MAKPTAAAPDYPVPETDEQIVALQKALATAYKTKLEKVRAILDSDAAKAFTEALNEAAALNLPTTGNTRANINAMLANMTTMSQSLDAEIQQAENSINPPADPAAGPVPLV